LIQDPATASVHVAAAVSLEEVLGQLLADYALQQPSVRVRTVFGASDELADHLLAGAPVDLFLTADAHQLDRLVSAGVLEVGTSAVLAENTLAAIAPTDVDLPVRRPKDLLHPSVTRLAIAEPASPLGGYTHAYLAQVGLYDALRPRVMLVDNSRAVLAALHAKQAEIGLVYGSDAATAANCRILFRAQRTVPPIRYLAGLGRQSQQADQARALLRFLTSGPAARRFRQCGFLPVGND
jgi:molybdate transport system substrate-binding protein